jgi:ubiquinone biosynthesis protein UbiJ
MIKQNLHRKTYSNLHQTWKQAQREIASAITGQVRVALGNGIPRRCFL